MTELISPNWHVILIHYPLALLTVGVVIEILSFLWKRSTVRTAGRWMILLGALAALPTITTGIFAFADAAKGSSTHPDGTWAQLVSGSRWGDAQWSYMRYHIWLATTSTGLFVLTLLVWLGSSDAWRMKLRWPVLAALIIALGGISAGAWFSGEAVYRYGVAVTPPAAVNVAPSGAPAVPAPTQQPRSQQPTTEQATTQETSTTQQATTTQAASQTPSSEVAERQPTEREPNQEQRGTAGGWQAYMDPLQLHLLLVGFTLALAVGALGVTLRRWAIQAKPAAEAPAAGIMPEREGPLALEETPRFPGMEKVEPMPPAGKPAEIRPLVVEPPAVYPARFWLLAGLVALLTGAAGLWLAEGDWRLPETTSIIQKAASHQELTKDQNRLLIHFILGINIILLPLILALITRFSRGLKVITLIGVALLLVAVGFQVWYGVMLLYNF
ncbi:MAG: DUF2231 domain-containing protein [Bacillota bacterium]